MIILKADGKLTETSLQLQSTNQWNDGSAMFLKC